ncbi:MAG: hypothetical protein NTV05_13255 [Acidobacteria bacterium]|nr:hypothetical protein [Acidobacteriota bacterium]
MSMIGVRMGERILHAGVGDPRVFGLVSSKVGLTGRACAVVDSAAAQATLEKAAARQGVFVEVVLAPGGCWPGDSPPFDLAVVDANALLSAPAAERHSRLSHTVRVVRPGGRVIAILRRPRGIAARLGFEPASGPPGGRTLELVRAFEQAGCRPVRVLAEREGLSFVEGFRPNVSVI